MSQIEKLLQILEKDVGETTSDVFTVAIYDQLSKWLAVQRKGGRVWGQRDTRTKIGLNGMGK